MNLEALKEIVENNVELIEWHANDSGVSQYSAVGVAKYAADHGYGKLSDKQRYVFDTCIRKLIERVRCEGYKHECEEANLGCPNVINEEDLVIAYSTNEPLCNSCQTQRSVDERAEERFFAE